jgi:hypothetical protein
LHLDASALGGVGDATFVIRTQRRVVRDDPMNAVDARLERAVEVHVVLH